jgi:hypothetical protein
MVRWRDKLQSASTSSVDGGNESLTKNNQELMLIFLTGVEKQIEDERPKMSQLESSQADLLLQNKESICLYLFEWFQNISRQLQLENVILIPFFNRQEGMGQNTRIGDTAMVKINVFQLLSSMDKWNDSSLEQYLPKSRLKRIIAHESFHVYVEQHYPKTYQKSAVANATISADKKSTTAYTLDRGEIASNLFEIEVLRFLPETNPEQHRIDLLVADELYKELDNSLHQAKVDQSQQQFEQTFRKLMNMFPHTRLFLRFVDRFLKE